MRSRWRPLAVAVLLVPVVAGCVGQSRADDGHDGGRQDTREEVFAPSFDGPDGLVTNERAYPSPASSTVRTSEAWMVTSGSLFARNGMGYSGEPDGESPDVRSTNTTGSAVFRAVSRQHVFSEVAVTAQMRVADLVETERTPEHNWDGLHLFLRYQDEDNVYTVDVLRRDGTLTIKRKSGGDYELLAEVEHEVPRDRWVDVRAAARTIAGDVRITLSIDGERVLAATDTSDEAITEAGRVGIRGDNCEFYFRDFRAWTPKGPAPFLSPSPSR